MTLSSSTVPTLEVLIPRLPVADIQRSLTYYCQQLGFTVGWTWGNPITHANVHRDAVNLDLTLKSRDTAGPALLYVRVKRVDRYFEELSHRGVKIGLLKDRAYGMRDFEIADLDGNQLAFGEAITGPEQ